MPPSGMPGGLPTSMRASALKSGPPPSAATPLPPVPPPVPPVLPPAPLPAAPPAPALPPVPLPPVPLPPLPALALPPAPPVPVPPRPPLLPPAAVPLPPVPALPPAAAGACRPCRLRRSPPGVRRRPCPLPAATRDETAAASASPLAFHACEIRTWVEPPCSHRAAWSGPVTFSQIRHDVPQPACSLQCCSAFTNNDFARCRDPHTVEDFPDSGYTSLSHALRRSPHSSVPAASAPGAGRGAAAGGLPPAARARRPRVAPDRRAHRRGPARLPAVPLPGPVHVRRAPGGRDHPAERALPAAHRRRPRGARLRIDDPGQRLGVPRRLARGGAGGAAGAGRSPGRRHPRPATSAGTRWISGMALEPAFARASAQLSRRAEAAGADPAAGDAGGGQRLRRRHPRRLRQGVRAQRLPDLRRRFRHRRSVPPPGPRLPGRIPRSLPGARPPPHPARVPLDRRQRSAGGGRREAAAGRRAARHLRAVDRPRRPHPLQDQAERRQPARGLRAHRPHRSHHRAGCCPRGA